MQNESSPVLTTAHFAETESTTKAKDSPGNSISDNIALEKSRHDVAFAHAIDIDVSGLSAKRALRHLPVLSGIDLKNATQKTD